MDSHLGQYLFPYFSQQFHEYIYLAIVCMRSYSQQWWIKDFQLQPQRHVWDMFLAKSFLIDETRKWEQLFVCFFKNHFSFLTFTIRGLIMFHIHISHLGIAIRRGKDQHPYQSLILCLYVFISLVLFKIIWEEDGISNNKRRFLRIIDL